jgi:dTDP-4-amino-4,6-dideoxygalactose transaminase
VKLPHLDSWSAGRRKNAELYSKFFIEAGLAEAEGNLIFDDKNKVLLPKAIYKSEIRNYHIYNQYIIRTKKRNELRDFLSKNNIGTEVYYPVPFHLQECFSYLKYKAGDFPLAEEAADSSLALPIFPELSQDQIHYVVEKIKEFINK